MTDLERYILARWRALSGETQRFLLRYDDGLNYTRLLWEKQYWQRKADGGNHGNSDCMGRASGRLQSGDA